VQQFVSAWVTEVRARGYLAGVYGSAASTIRDVAPLLMTAGTGAPDAVWIASWDGRQSVFGDRFVDDALWAAHQRLHQFTGGHRETYGGVTLNIDSSVVDGPAVAPTVAAPAAPAAGGTAASSDGRAVATWLAGAVPAGGLLTVSHSKLSTAAGGFAAGGDVFRLAVTQAGAPLPRLAAPVTVHLGVPAAGLRLVSSPDGSAWTPLPAGSSSVEPDGTVDVTTATPALYGLLRDVAGPTPPVLAAARIVRGTLTLRWRPSTDNAGVVAGYRITRDGDVLATVPGTAARAAVRAAAASFGVVAVDAAGNASAASVPVTVTRAPRPAGVPRAIPRYAFALLDWLRSGRAGARPAAPRAVPAWFWRWAGWRLHPLTLAGPAP